MGIKTVITLYPKRQNKNINERNVYMYNLYNYLSYILFSVFLRKTMKKFSSLPLKSPMCENVVNFYIYLTSCSLKSENESLYYVFSIQCTRPCL